MKYIIKPAVKVYGVYIGEEGKYERLVKGAKYLIDSVSVSREGIMYVSVLIPQKPLKATNLITAINFKFVDIYGFKYNPPFHKGLTFKYEYDMDTFTDDYGLDLPHMHVRYAFNMESGDGVYTVYPLFNDDIMIATPLFEGSFEYSNDINARTTIRSRVKAVMANNDKSVIYSFNGTKMAQLSMQNGIHEFTRYMIKDNTSEISSFSVSKFKNMYMKFTSNPSKYLNERPGFSEAIFSIRTDFNVTSTKNIPIN